MNSQNLIEVNDMKKYFKVSTTSSRNIFGKDVVYAVDGVSFAIKEGETVGLVGESGCGKTTLGRCILRLIEPDSGTVKFDSVDIASLDKGRMRMIRKDMQIIFQDPFSSLDPRMRVGDIISEPFTTFGVPGGESKNKKVEQLLEAVGLGPESRRRFPHEFSGGQRQRIAIARALALNPRFVVADEPVSALDVSNKAQILNLMKSLKNDFHLTYLFISHDLSTVKFISSVVAVMYLGKIVELGPVNKIFKNAAHPYTKVLMSSVPIPDPFLKRERILLEGELPSSIKIPSGCRFHTRCSYAMDICKKDEPERIEIGTEHTVLCHLHKR